MTYIDKVKNGYKVGCYRTVEFWQLALWFKCILYYIALKRACGGEGGLFLSFIPRAISRLLPYSTVLAGNLLSGVARSWCLGHGPLTPIQSQKSKRWLALLTQWSTKPSPQTTSTASIPTMHTPMHSLSCCLPNTNVLSPVCAQPLLRSPSQPPQRR